MANRPQALERILQSQGFGGRKECRALITAGCVVVDGQPWCDPAQTIVAHPTTQIGVKGETWPWREHQYIALFKPAGYECSHTPQHHRSVFSLLPRHFVARGVQAAGRLDADTTGLLLLSDDGAWLHALASPRRHVAKTYLVHTCHDLDDSHIQALLGGVQLHGEVAPLAVLRCEQSGARVMALTIDQGKYHQVKRMVAASGNRVEALHRIAVGGLRLGHGPLATLTEGRWMELDNDALGLLTPQHEHSPAG